MKRVRKKRMVKILIICISIGVLYLFFSFIKNFYEKPPGKLKSIESGDLTEQALSNAAKIIGTKFTERPSRLFYFSSEPDKYGGYSAWVKADISKQEFENVVKKMKWLKEDDWPSESPLRSAPRWIGPKHETLQWWNPSSGKNEKDVYGLFLGEVGYCFIKYENSTFFYHAAVMKWK